MNYRKLGNTEIWASEIGVGCWAIGGPDWNLNMEMGWCGINDDESLKGLFFAFDMGANYFDTADIYGHGHSERIIGEFVKNIDRSKVIIGSKVGYFSGTAPNAYHPVNIRNQLDMSLSNLKSEYIDIYFIHNFNFGDNDEYLDDAIDLMLRFKEEGKIRFIGQRGPHTYAPNRKVIKKTKENKYQRFLNISSKINPDIIQIRYNMLSPTFDESDTDIFTWAEEKGIGIIINKPLSQGLLLDKYNPTNPPIFDSGDHRNRKSWYKKECLEILHNRLTILKKYFANDLESLVRIALQYCLSRSENAIVIPGFKNKKQIEMNINASGKYLSAQDLTFIRDTMSGIHEELGKYF